MTVDIQYRIDDVVNFNYEKKEACSFCSGSGELMGHDGTTVACPKCTGVGMFELSPKVITSEKGNITNIEIKWKTGEAAPAVIYTIDMVNGGEVKIPQADITEKVN